jgi:hypothetical protein
LAAALGRVLVFAVAALLARAISLTFLIGVW